MVPVLGADSRSNRRSKPKNDNLHRSIQLHLQMQKGETEDEFQPLLAEHDRLTDADGKPRLVLRTLIAFQRGPANGPPVQPPQQG
jgi:hypothetical protein